jgi:hypothetical protein
MKKEWLFYGVVTSIAGLVLYLSWQPHPQMATDWFIPSWVANWADEGRNHAIRTAVPFLVLGWLIGGWLSMKNRPWLQWPLAWVGLTALVVVAEVGQLFLKSRLFDLRDIGWGMAGGLLGLGTVAALRGLYLAWRPRRAQG